MSWLWWMALHADVGGGGRIRGNGMPGRMGAVHLPSMRLGAVPVRLSAPAFPAMRGWHGWMSSMHKSPSAVSPRKDAKARGNWNRTRPGHDFFGSMNPPNHARNPRRFEPVPSPPTNPLKQLDRPASQAFPVPIIRSFCVIRGPRALLAPQIWMRPSKTKVAGPFRRTSWNWPASSRKLTASSSPP